MILNQTRLSLSSLVRTKAKRREVHGSQSPSDLLKDSEYFNKNQ